MNVQRTCGWNVRDCHHSARVPSPSTTTPSPCSPLLLLSLDEQLSSIGQLMSAWWNLLNWWACIGPKLQWTMSVDDGRRAEFSHAFSRLIQWNILITGRYCFLSIVAHFWSNNTWCIHSAVNAQPKNAFENAQPIISFILLIIARIFRIKHNCMTFMAGDIFRTAVQRPLGKL